jgi:hypothetical protein
MYAMLQTCGICRALGRLASCRECEELNRKANEELKAKQEEKTK